MRVDGRSSFSIWMALHSTGVDQTMKDLVFFLLLLFFFFNFILTIALPPTLLKRRKDGMGVVYSEITPF